MAKFTFIVPPLSGHVNPTLSLGAGLLQSGHEVSWISLEPSLAGRLPQGGQLLLVPQQEEANDSHHSYINSISQKNVYGVESIRFLYDDVLIPLNRHLFHHINHLLDQYQPHLVLHDHQVFAGAMAAWQKSIPFVTSITAPAAVKMKDDLPAIHQWEMNKILALQQELGIEADAPIAASDKLSLLYTTQEFFGNTLLPDTYQFIGPLTAHRPATIAFNWPQFHAMTQPKKILVSIGTTFDHAYKKDFFSKLITAFAEEPVGVVVVSDPALFDSWPSNFMVQEKVPQLELLPLMDAVVCHGGQNTVSESLAQGLPLVVVPIAYDQSYVASRVHDTQCGIRLNYKRFKPEHLKDAVAQVLTDLKYKHAARHMQSSFAQAGGIPKAIRLLEKMLHHQQALVA